MRNIKKIIKINKHKLKKKDDECEEGNGDTHN